MSAVEHVIADMRENADAMKPCPAKRLLLSWADRLQAAIEADAAEPVPEPKRLHGVYDNLETGYRELYADGHLQQRMPKHLCPQNRPWRKFPDVPR